jgi:hypothetical protein
LIDTTIYNEKGKEEMKNKENKENKENIRERKEEIKEIKEIKEIEYEMMALVRVWMKWIELDLECEKVKRDLESENNINLNILFKIID